MGDELRHRLEVAFREHTGANTGHGALTWIANLARLDRRTVTRALTGEIPPTRVEAALDLLDAGQRAASREGAQSG